MESKIEQLIKNFLTRLRVALGNATIYSPDHSVFLKSLEEVQRAMDAVLNVIKQIQVFIGPHYLIIEEEKLENDKLYEELSRWFHIRSVKSFSVKRGVTLEETTVFISKVTKRPNEILDQGGLAKILEKQQVSFITAETLSYDEILHNTKGDQDIWAYLLKEALNSRDDEQIEAVVRNFDRMFRDVGIKHFMGEEELQMHLEAFLAYVKEHHNRAFFECLAHMVKALLASDDPADWKAIPQKFQEYFRLLDARDLSGIILDRLLCQEAPDFQAFFFIDAIMGGQGHDTIAAMISEKIEQRISPKINAEWLEKTAGLFSTTDNDMLKKVYQPVFSYYHQKFLEEDIYHFDRDSWPKRYKGFLLNLFFEEEDSETLGKLIDGIAQEWKAIEEPGQLIWYQNLLEVRERKHNRHPDLEDVMQRLDRMVGSFIEEKVLRASEADLKELEPLIKMFRYGFLGPEPYLDKIFKDGDIQPLMLRTFFKLYPKEQDRFFQRLDKTLHDTRYVLTLIQNIQDLAPSLKLDIFKRLFFSPNAYIRLEALKQMSGLPVCDRAFMIEVLINRENDFNVRQYSLQALMAQEDARHDIAAVLFSSTGPFEKNRAALIENMQLAGAVHFYEAKPYIVQLSKRPFFWNRKLRNQALAVLGGWENG